MNVECKEVGSEIYPLLSKISAQRFVEAKTIYLLYCNIETECYISLFTQMRLHGTSMRCVIILEMSLMSAVTNCSVQPANFACSTHVYLLTPPITHAVYAAPPSLVALLELVNCVGDTGPLVKQ